MHLSMPLLSLGLEKKPLKKNKSNTVVGSQFNSSSSHNYKSGHLNRVPKAWSYKTKVDLSIVISSAQLGFAA